MFKCTSESNKGKVRDNNEDFLITDPENNIFIIADGVGGNQAGEIASKYVANALHEFLTDPQTERTIQNLKNILNKINKDLIFLSQSDPLFVGMSTTLVFSLIENEKIIIGNVGDSRCYIFRNRNLTQITEDHSVVQQLVESNTIQPVEAFDHHLKHLITMAMGNKSIDPDFYEEDFFEGDTIILCSDGLSDMVNDQNIATIMNIDESLERKAVMLTNKALENGGLDNISIILINKSWD